MNSPLYMIVATAVLGLSALSYTAVAENQENAQSGTSTLQLLASSSGAHSASDLQVGDMIDPERMQLIDTPGAYGLSLPPTGNRYAVVADYLVRIDPASGKILSILRQIDPDRA